MKYWKLLIETIDTTGEPNNLAALFDQYALNMTTQNQILNEWVELGKPEFKDPAEFNQCLEAAIIERNVCLLKEITSLDRVDWEQEDSLADEVNELLDVAHRIVNANS